MRSPLALAALLTTLAACERKAPGPDECQRFSYRVAGVTRREQLTAPALRERVDELIRQCLTTPYDKEFIGCVEGTGRLRACTLDFERRKQRRPAEPDPQEWFVR